MSIIAIKKSSKNYKMFKEIFYDWFGLNLKIFLAINHFFSNQNQDDILAVYFRAVSFIGAAKNFVYEVFALILLQAIISFKNSKKIGKNAAILEAIDFMIKCAVVLATLLLFIHPLKHSIHFKRPLCLPELKVHMITEYDTSSVEDLIDKRCHKGGGNDSLPSGHAVLATLLSLLGIQVLGKKSLPIFAAYLVSIVVARLAMGLHYPADILAGILIAVATFILGSVISSVTLPYFNRLMEKYLLK